MGSNPVFLNSFHNLLTSQQKHSWLRMDGHQQGRRVGRGIEIFKKKRGFFVIFYHFLLLLQVKRGRGKIRRGRLLEGAFLLTLSSPHGGFKLSCIAFSFQTLSFRSIKRPLTSFFLKLPLHSLSSHPNLGPLQIFFSCLHPFFSSISQKVSILIESSGKKKKKNSP